MNRKKKIVLGLVLGIVILAVILDIGIGNYLVNFAIVDTHSAGTTVDTTLDVSTSQEQMEVEELANERKETLTAAANTWADSWDKENLEILSLDQLKLQATLYKPEDGGSHLWAILLHGYSRDCQDMVPYAKEFVENGYSVLTPDQRSCGESEGEFTSMGWFEKDDLELWIDYVLDQDQDAQIVLQGISMGASTVMMASGDDLPSNVKVIIEDCGYTSVWDEFSNKLEAIFHLPTFPILNTASLICDLRMGFSFTEASSVNQLAKNETPMLFIHGSEDDLNPFWMLDVLYEADANEEKEKLVVEGARHAMSSYTDPEKYWKEVWDFTDTYIDR